jgi:hypothetical protein
MFTGIGKISISDDEKTFLLITWEMDGVEYKNHYFTNIIDIDYEKYVEAMNKCGFDELEGFQAE